jgi:diguanylate cyclase (GGDEF)-like protein
MTSNTIYPLLSTGLVLVMIFLDFKDRLNTDVYRRKIYLSVLSAIFAALCANFAVNVLNGRPGAAVHVIMYIAETVFHLSRNLSYFLAVVLMDYLANKNSLRNKKLLYIAMAMIAINIIIMASNIPGRFFFYVTGDNHIMRGSHYLLRFYLGYSAVLLAIVDIFMSAKFLKQTEVYLIIFFSVLIGTGAALDIIFSSEILVWACFVPALLFSYFYIIKTDSTMDRITGIGNRSNFNEFMNQLVHMNTKQSCYLAMFDINGLKKINDAEGVAEGDKALAGMADILKKCTRQSDFIARIGADEFIIVIKAKFDIEKLLARFLKTLENYNNNPDPERKHVLSIAYGFDKFETKSDQSIEEFMTRLNTLVFQHKSDQREAAKRD